MTTLHWRDVVATISCWLVPNIELLWVASLPVGEPTLKTQIRGRFLGGKFRDFLANRKGGKFLDEIKKNYIWSLLPLPPFFLLSSLSLSIYLPFSLFSSSSIYCPQPINHSMRIWDWPELIPITNQLWIYFLVFYDIWFKSILIPHPMNPYWL